MWRPDPDITGAGRLAIINGHPDPRPERFCAALCEAHEAGARWAGRPVRRLDTGALAPGEPVFQETMHWADDVTVVFPLWLNCPPSTLRDMFAQLASADAAGPGRKARLVVTMELPAFAHRAAYERDSVFHHGLALPGFAAEPCLFIGSTAHLTPAQREYWLATMRRTGMAAEGPAMKRRLPAR